MNSDQQSDFHSIELITLLIFMLMIKVINFLLLFSGPKSNFYILN